MQWLLILPRVKASIVSTVCEALQALAPTTSLTRLLLSFPCSVHWPPWRPSNRLGPLSPQSLCAGYSHYLESFFLAICLVNSLAFFKSFLKSHLLNEAYLTTLLNAHIPSHCGYSWASFATLLFIFPSCPLPCTILYNLFIYYIYCLLTAPHQTISFMRAGIFVLSPIILRTKTMPGT